MNTPSKICCWNWGAFWLGPIWALGNRVWIGLLCGLPLAGASVQFWISRHFNWDYWNVPAASQNNIVLGSLFFAVVHLLLYPSSILMLAANGNQWAWKNNRYKSIKQFETIQWLWAIAGWGLGTPVFLISFLGPFLLLLFSIAPFMAPYAF